jgi:putative nucleotidyltransferase with HDIG domain
MVRSAHIGSRDDDGPGRPRGRLAATLGALSLAADLGVGLPAQSALRMALIAARLGKTLGLDAPARSELYYTALLRYLGCSGFAHEEAAITAGDDRVLLPALELCDATRPREVAAAVVRNVGRGRPLVTRAAAVARFLSDPRGYAKVARAHCEQAVALARGLELPAAVPTSLGQLYERHDGRGAPHGLAGDAIALPARIAVLAQTAEAFFRAGGVEAATEIVRKRKYGQLDPAVAEAFLGDADAILKPLAAPSVWDAFLEAEPEPQRTFSPTGLDATAVAFAAYVDLKSPFTLGHSTGVARLAEAAAREAQMSKMEARTLRLAALLHDLGRAAVSNGIWDKAGPLDSAEREQIRWHAYHGERVLRQTPILAPLAVIVAGHHERLDGTGYHRGLGGAALDRSVRLLAACDVYHALTEARPWRPAHPPEEAARQLRDAVAEGRLDRDAVSAVLAASGQRSLGQRNAWPDGLTEREVEVLRLVARGLSNKEIGRALHISPVTVKNHVAHLYDKTGVATRSAAALYAVTKGLVEP